MIEFLKNYGAVIHAYLMIPVFGYIVYWLIRHFCPPNTDEAETPAVTAEPSTKSAKLAEVIVIARQNLVGIYRDLTTAALMAGMTRMALREIIESPTPWKMLRKYNGVYGTDFICVVQARIDKDYAFPNKPAVYGFLGPEPDGMITECKKEKTPCTRGTDAFFRDPEIYQKRFMENYPNWLLWTRIRKYGDSARIVFRGESVLADYYNAGLDVVDEWIRNRGFAIPGGHAHIYSTQDLGEVK